MVETTASEKDGGMKAQERRKSGREEGTNIERGRKKRGYRKRKWWPRCRDFTKKIFGREEEEEEEERQGKRKERQVREKRKEDGIWRDWEDGFPHCDDRAKFRKSKCGFEQLSEQRKSES